jgi:TolB protein
VFNGTASGEDFFQVYTANPDMSGQQKITNSRLDEYSPEWSPNGAQILFISERDNTNNSGLYVMDADGSDARLLFNGPTEEWGATWSPDGAQIVFAVDQPDGTADIYIMNADGNAPRRLTERGGYPSWARALGQPQARSIFNRLQPVSSISRGFKPA